MTNVKKIALFGLYNYDNLGDPLLAQCCEYIIKKNFEDIEIIKGEILPNNKSYIAILICFIRSLLYKFHFAYPKALDILNYYIYKFRGMSYYKNILKKSDAIIFVGGAYLKWNGEYFQYGIRNILNYAERYNIPVMFNGIGVEGYSDSDVRCVKLKKKINSKCVKVITTRDDLITLNTNFITRDDIKSDIVADPAFFLDDLYSINHIYNRKYVGINITYLNLFSIYNVNSPYTLEELMRSIIRKFQECGIEFRLYCNGKIEDYRGGLQLLKKLNLNRDILLPRAKTPLELINQINSFRYIIPLRLHSCIIAYILGVGFSSFVWNRKMILFSKVVGRQNEFKSIQDFDVDWIIDNIESSAFDHCLNDSKKRNQELKLRTESYLKNFIKDYVLNSRFD